MRPSPRTTRGGARHHAEQQPWRWRRRCPARTVVAALLGLGAAALAASFWLVVRLGAGNGGATRGSKRDSPGVAHRRRSQRVRNGDAWPPPRPADAAARSLEVRENTLNTAAPKASNDPTLMTNTSSAACMLIMDDNHWLVEWLAYHYTTLNLRRMIVAIDERSRTSPVEIFDRYAGRIEVEFWNDTHIFRGSRPFPEDASLQTINLARQQTFLTKCMQTLRLRPDAGWTFFTDTDEFITVNRRARHRASGLYRAFVPGLERPGSIMAFLEEEKRRNQSVCFSMGRLQFGPDEAPAAEVERDVPSALNASQFLTFRWLTGAGELMGPKNVVDLSAVDPHAIPADATNQHRVLSRYCGAAGDAWNRRNSLLQVYQYLGTLEQFQFRDDARLSSQSMTKGRNGRFDRFVGVVLEKADDLRPWIHGFFRLVGAAEAMRLLEANGRTTGWAGAEAHAHRFAPPDSVPSQWPPKGPDDDDTSGDTDAEEEDDDDGLDENAPTIPAGGAFYSQARPDRSGAAIADMLLAHAYAFAHDLHYGGACGDQHDRYQAETNRLIRTIGLEDILKFTCPRDNEEAPVVDRTVYFAEKATLWNANYLARLRERLRYPAREYDAVVHVRRGDVSPCGAYANRYLPNAHYLAILDAHVPPNKRVAVFSESDAFEAFDDFRERGYAVHLDSSLNEVWSALLTADYVVLSKSSFSFVPAMLNRGATVLYTPFLHPPLPGWNTVAANILARSQRRVQELAKQCTQQ